MATERSEGGSLFLITVGGGQPFNVEMVDGIPQGFDSKGVQVSGVALSLVLCSSLVLYLIGCETG